MKNLKEMHDKHISKLKESGVALTKFECPECGAVISTRVPDSGVYDTMSVCPECGEMFFKIVYSDGKVEIK